MTRINFREWPRGMVIVIAIAGVNVLLMLLLVVMGVSHPQPPAFTPTPLMARPAGGRLVGPRTFTVDATASDRWRYFSFDQGTLVVQPGPVDWDLAFRRFEVIVNGGSGFSGQGGLIDLGEVEFEQVRAVPSDGYVETTAGSDSTNSAVRKWYDYSYLSHVLSPKPRVYAVRTAAGHYAKLRFEGYYCPGATPGCVTFRYVYQGGGGVVVSPSTQMSGAAP